MVFVADPSPGDDTKWTWAWWGVMTSIATFNAGFLYKAAYAQKWSTSDPALRSYQKWCLYLAVPFVFECGYRSWLPSVYNSRQTLWDSFFNSIVVDRTFAAVGELCWIFQIGMVARYINGGFPSPSGLVHYVTYLPFLLCVLAECFSYYCTGTTCYKWCTYEVSLWTAAFSIMCPVALFLLCKISALKYQAYNDTSTKSASTYAMVLFLATLVYVPYMIFDNIPMYWQRYQDDQSNNVQYFSFVPGMRDALYTRNMTRSWTLWEPEWFWMVAYFSLAAWSSILMVWAPRITNSARRDAQLTMLETGDRAELSYRSGWLKYKQEREQGTGVVV